MRRTLPKRENDFFIYFRYVSSNSRSTQKSRLANSHVGIHPRGNGNLPRVAAENYVEPDTSEVRIRYSCDVQKMRSDYAFLNELALNVDTYDVYVRDGLAPWFEQFDRAHRRVDEALQIEHGR